MDKSNPWVAVVDDEPTVRRAVLRVLRLAKIPAREFSSGAQFLEAPEAPEFTLPGCVLLDIVMPEMSGLEVLARIRKCTADLPVILMSGNINPASQIPAEQGGMVNFLAKPFHASTLVDAINAALGTAADQLKKNRPDSD